MSCAEAGGLVSCRYLIPANGSDSLSRTHGDSRFYGLQKLHRVTCSALLAGGLLRRNKIPPPFDRPCSQMRQALFYGVGKFRGVCSDSWHRTHARVVLTGVGISISFYFRNPGDGASALFGTLQKRGLLGPDKIPERVFDSNPKPLLHKEFYVCAGASRFTRTVFRFSLGRASMRQSTTSPAIHRGRCSAGVACLGNRG